MRQRATIKLIQPIENIHVASSACVSPVVQHSTHAGIQTHSMKDITKVGHIRITSSYTVYSTWLKLRTPVLQTEPACSNSMLSHNSSDAIAFPPKMSATFMLMAASTYANLMQRNVVWMMMLVYGIIISAVVGHQESPAT
jgi:hypothetical protein